MTDAENERLPFTGNCSFFLLWEASPQAPFEQPQGGAGYASYRRFHDFGKSIFLKYITVAIIVIKNQK